MYHHLDLGRNPVSTSPPTASKPHNLETKFVVCINNRDYPASLEVRKIYQVIPDNRAAEHQSIRVIDESGEDYLYPVAYFVPIALPKAVEAVFA
jgi:hypothetical protein